MSIETDRSNYSWAVNQQAWGIAIMRNHVYEWTYGSGPKGWEKLTKRRALLAALESNNGRIDGPYVPLPLPGFFAQKDFESGFFPYTGGPHPEECAAIYKAASDLLVQNPYIDWKDLPHL